MLIPLLWQCKRVVWWTPALESLRAYCCPPCVFLERSYQLCCCLKFCIVLRCLIVHCLRIYCAYKFILPSFSLWIWNQLDLNNLNGPRPTPSDPLPIPDTLNSLQHKNLHHHLLRRNRDRLPRPHRFRNHRHNLSLHHLLSRKPRSHTNSISCQHDHNSSSDILCRLLPRQ